MLKSEFLQKPKNKRIRLKYSSLKTESLRIYSTPKGKDERIPIVRQLSINKQIARFDKKQGGTRELAQNVAHETSSDTALNRSMDAG